MDSPSAPQAPDPYATANAQAGANKDAALLTAQLNRVNQYTPYGSLTYTQGAPTRTFNQQRYDEAVKAAQNQGSLFGMGGFWQDSNAENGSPTWVPNAGTPGSPGPLPDRNAEQFYDTTPSTQWSSQISLDPRVQAVLDAQLSASQGLQGVTNSALGRVDSTLGQPVDYSSLPAAPTADAGARQRVEDALYGRYTSRLNPRFDQEEAAMRSNLINRGIPEGSQAWNTELANFNRAKNDAYSTAQQDAAARGGQEMETQFNLGSRARQDALSEVERRRGLVLNELAALRSGQQVNMPQFSNTQSGAMVNPAPIAQMLQNQYQGQLGAYNAGVGSNNALLGGLASLGAGAMMAPAGTFAPLLAAI